jgi:hypothetical protein
MANVEIKTVIDDILSSSTKVTTLQSNVSTNTTNIATNTKNISSLSSSLSDLQGYVGYEDSEIAGICADWANKTFTRLAGAKGLSAGSDFDKFTPFGGRKRCNVADDGTINAYYGDSGYKEDGSNGQVMVYQPKFYYKMVPLVLEQQTDGLGYHVRKANYYMCATPRDGFKCFPAFTKGLAKGLERDYIMLPGFEGCIYDTSASAYITDDSQVMNVSEDKFSSIANVRAASGLSQNLTRPNINQMCQNRGSTWYSMGIQEASVTQWLMLIEFGIANTQTALGQGVVSITDNSSYNCSSYTGSTSSLGNASGQATSTKDYTGTSQTTSDKLAVSYRGQENPWGNIWKFVDGINIYGNGSQKGGVPYICTDYNYAESKNSDNYESAGFTVTNTSGYISAFGYGNEDYDWLFFASECGGGNSALPVGDYNSITSNLNGYRVAEFGGSWTDGSTAGSFYWFLAYGVGIRRRNFGGCAVQIPNA